MKRKPINIKKINILLGIYHFLALLVGLYISNTPDGRDYVLFVVWLACIGANALVTHLLAVWITRLEEKLHQQ